jgi:hypothetical protein
MKYSEYQVWFHAFNNAVSALSHKDYNVNELCENSAYIADYVIEKFSKVEVPEAPPGLDAIDIQGIVNQVIKKKTQ